jgi:hypothetical protein
MAQQLEHTKKLLDVLLGISDGGAGDYELRGAAVLPQADAPQPAQHQRSMAAKHAPVVGRRLNCFMSFILSVTHSRASALSTLSRI